MVVTTPRSFGELLKVTACRRTVPPLTEAIEVHSTDSRRIATACFASGTMCCSLIFIRNAGIRQCGCEPSRSNSDQAALRSSPGRTNSNGASRRAQATGSVPEKPSMARISSPTSFGSVMLAWCRVGRGRSVFDNPLQGVCSQISSAMAYSKMARQSCNTLYAVSMRPVPSIRRNTPRISAPLHICHGVPADPGEDMLLKPAGVSRAMTFAPALPLEPFTSNRLEGAQVRDSSCGFGSLALGAGVDAVGQKLPGLIPLLPRTFQRDFGIDAERQNLLCPPRLPSALARIGT